MKRVMQMSPTPARPSFLRRHLTGESVIPAVALLLLPALAAGLTYHAVAAERSHRRAAESALRDYAAFAAWQLDRHADEHLDADLWTSVYKARELKLADADPLPPASLLSPDTGACGCGFK